MSTSHYSSRPPYRGPLPPPNTRRRTSWQLATIGGLLLVDLAALAGSKDLAESLILVGLVLVNLWAINYTRQ